METINSLKHELIQRARKLNSAKARVCAEEILLTGTEHISWAIEHKWNIEYIITSHVGFETEYADVFTGIKVFKASEGLLKKITDTKYLVDTVAVAKNNVFYLDDDFIIVLDNVQDYGNIGTIIRTANAFNITNIITTRNDYDIFHKRTIEASRGTVFRTGVKYLCSAEEAMKYLKQKGYQLVTASPYGKELQSLVNLGSMPIALIVGNESNGVSDICIKESDMVVQIPMSPTIESLNVGVATGISVYELRLKQVIAMIEDKIKSTLGRDMNVVAMLIQKALDVELKSISDLDSMSLIFLMVLRCDKKMSRNEIQKQFAILDDEFSQFINNLESRELIFGEKEEYRITKSGIELLGKLWPVIEQTENKIFHDVSVEEKEVFYKVLKKLEYRVIDMIK